MKNKNEFKVGDLVTFRNEYAKHLDLPDNAVAFVIGGGASAPAPMVLQESFWVHLDDGREKWIWKAHLNKVS